VLWVAGAFEHHAYELANLREHANIETATSTSDAIVKLKARTIAIDAVISGMSRTEHGVHDPTAGITLTSEARALGYKGPIYIFCTADNVKAHGAEAMRTGAQGVTASPVQLFEWLRKTACMTSVANG
jgi:CheY-like chemotaxis protein